jgi:quinol monooxygenase YgiN
VQDPITVFAIIEVPDADMIHVKEAVSELARQSILEAGCVRYDVYRSRKHPVRLIIQELWADDAAIERHRGSSHVKAFKAELAGTEAQIWASQCETLDWP